MNLNDEIVEEVRKVRDEHAAKFNYDISTICADIRQKQIESGREIITDKTKLRKELLQNADFLKVA